MGMVRKFYKRAGPTIEGFGTPCAYYRNSYSEVAGDKKTPNDYTLNLAWFSYSFGTSFSYERDRPTRGFNVSTGRTTDPRGIRSFSLVTEWDTRNPVLDTPLFQEAYRKAVSKLFNEAKAENWNAAVFLAETRESWSMITTAATRLYAFQKAIRKGRLKDAYKALGISDRNKYGKAGKRRYPPANTVRNNYDQYMLETQLGWKPLLSDMYEGAKAIAQAIHTPPNPAVMKIQGRGTAWHNQVVNRPAPDSRFMNGVDQRNKKCSVEIGCYFTFGSKHRQLAAAFGFTNPLSLIWETIPLSFVVDYAYNIGEYLENLSAFHGMDFHSGYQTNTYRELFMSVLPSKGTWHEVYAFGEGQWFLQRYQIAGSCKTTEKYFGMSRSKLSAFPSSRPPRVYSTFKEDRDVRRALVITSLFGQWKSNR